MFITPLFRSGLSDACRVPCPNLSHETPGTNKSLRYNGLRPKKEEKERFFKKLFAGAQARILIVKDRPRDASEELCIIHGMMSCCQDSCAYGKFHNLWKTVYINDLSVLNLPDTEGYEDRGDAIGARLPG